MFMTVFLDLCITASDYILVICGATLPVVWRRHSVARINILESISTIKCVISSQTYQRWAPLAL